MPFLICPNILQPLSQASIFSVLLEKAESGMIIQLIL